jgi:hypothetical protein
VDERRRVLERVARGELTPAEAALLLDQLEAGAEGVTTVRGPEPDRAARVRIVRTFWPVEVSGDASVREAVAEGPHLVRRIGDALVVEGEPDEGPAAGFWFTTPWPGGPGRIRWPPGAPSGPASLRWMQRMAALWPPAGAWLRLRLNPDLPLEVETQVGSVRVRDLRAPVRLQLQAGRAALEGCSGPLAVEVQAGAVSLRGRLSRGTSRVRCEAGTVRVHLEPGSSLRVTAASTLGRVSLDGAETAPPWTIGAGEGELDIRTTMGSVWVTTVP